MLLRRTSVFLVSAVVAVTAAGPTVGAAATPVGCDDGPTPDGRVFPEPLVSLTYVTFDEFTCGMDLLDGRFPDLIEVSQVGTLRGWAPASSTW